MGGYNSILAIFKKNDIDNKLTLPAAKFKQIFAELDESLADDDVSELITQAGIDASGDVNYQKILCFIYERDGSTDLGPPPSSVRERHASVTGNEQASLNHKRQWKRGDGAAHERPPNSITDWLKCIPLDMQQQIAQMQEEIRGICPAVASCWLVAKAEPERNAAEKKDEAESLAGEAAAQAEEQRLAAKKKLGQSLGAVSAAEAEDEQNEDRGIGHEQMWKHAKGKEKGFWASGWVGPLRNLLVPCCSCETTIALMRVSRRTFLKLDANATWRAKLEVEYPFVLQYIPAEASAAFAAGEPLMKQLYVVAHGASHATTKLLPGLSVADPYDSKNFKEWFQEKQALQQLESQRAVSRVLHAVDEDMEVRFQRSRNKVIQLSAPSSVHVWLQLRAAWS